MQSGGIVRVSESSLETGFEAGFETSEPRPE
jgi:hypothetical protein